MVNTRRVWLLACVWLLLQATTSFPQVRNAPEHLPPDARYKTDIMVVVAHADDDTLIGGYLARAQYDEHKRIAVVFTTEGDHGENDVGNEQATSLGLVREMEARAALGSLGITNAWFLGAPNVGSHNPLWSLEKWPHAAVLEKTVRLIRLMRPEVVLTFLPNVVTGENHGDHQAAGVVATEAFDLAGDPTAFPEQVTPPHNHRGFGNMSEGLQPWQAKKLYYFTDAAHVDFVRGQGPEYSTKDVSTSRHVPYAKMVAQENSFYLSQPEGAPAARDLKDGNLRKYETPVYLVLGKSHVECSKTGDVFEGVAPGPIAFSPVGGFQPESRSGVSIELGAPRSFYHEFWKAHGIEHIGQLLAPEEGIESGQTLDLPLLIHNDTGQPVQVSVSVTIPPGWKAPGSALLCPVGPQDTYPLQVEYRVPTLSEDQWQTLTWRAEVNGRTVSSTSLRVLVATKCTSLWPAMAPYPFAEESLSACDVITTW